MRQNILKSVPTIRSLFPDEENIDQVGVYDARIENEGGIDLCLNALGEDGHTFGFNMPGDSFDSITRQVRVNEDTRRVNQELTGDEIPEFAVSTGIQTGMASKEVLVLASGFRKAGIVRRALCDPISEEVPATILRSHGRVRWIIDQAAAAYL